MKNNYSIKILKQVNERDQLELKKNYTFRLRVKMMEKFRKKCGGKGKVNKALEAMIEEFVRE